MQDTFTPSGEGSGIIINTDGYIVTNAHVVAGSTGINVELDNGETYSARLIGIDAKTDLAVIKIEAPDLIAAEFGNSDMLEVGETVVAIGNPGGSTLAGSVTQGIVSAVNRMIKDGGYSSSFIQTDAAINPGNSGGALVNEYGQVIGINSSKIAAVDYEGIGFAIPVSEAKPVIDQLMAYGYVKGRTKIGISGVEINQTLSQINSIPVGIYIQSIDPTSDLAGKNVRQGDIITAIDGIKIETFDDISAFLKTKSPGDNVTLTLYRSARGIQGSGQTFSVTMKLMEDIDNATLVSRQ
ncbi:putative serine protease HtrA [anaerobic digester metagenome]